ncbi:MAG: Crp/Fnr family transcriptional regulator [Lagierella massiliensis]|nr:Crp/Fnr family transcriptional regulator [Lagierella massiliensis]
MIWNEDILSRPLFKNISTESLAKLLRTNSKRKHYESNEVIFRKGENIKYFCIIERGLLKTSEYTNRGKEMSSSYFYYEKNLGTDYPFAIDAFPFYLIYGGTGKHTMDIYAVKSTTLIKIPIEEFKPIIESDSIFMLNVLNFVSQFACYGQIMLRAVEYRRIEERLAYWMLNVNESRKNIYIPYSQEVLAEMLHVNRSSLNQELGRLREQGLIDIYKRKITIKNLDYFIDLI